MRNNKLRNSLLFYLIFLVCVHESSIYFDIGQSMKRVLIITNTFFSLSRFVK